jgi:hypothetical protein
MKHESEAQLIRRIDAVWRKYNPTKNPNRPVQQLPDAPF